MYSSHIPCSKYTSHAKRFGELEEHSDICYVEIETLVSDYTMFTLLTDDENCYMTVYLLRHKSNAAQTFFEYDKQVLNLTGHHIQTL
jgi:hypothetical protein